MPDNYPKAWPRFTAHYRHSRHEPCERAIGDFGKLAKWSARFRLAKSFRALDLGDAYAGPDVPQLYSAITRIFLTYSAFETYCLIWGLKPSKESQVRSLQGRDAQNHVILAIRNLDPRSALADYLIHYSRRKSLKQAIHDFKTGNEVSISCLAEGIRHVFAHGVLSASAIGLPARKFDQISQLISEFLLDCMDEDFDRRVPD